MTTPSAETLARIESRPVHRAMALAAIFRFFSLACGYPTAERLQVVRNEALPAAYAAALIASRRLAPRLRRLVDHLDGTENAHLERRYHEAFGHMPLPDCPTYESAYLGANTFRQANVMADVAGFYRAFGLRIGSREHERVDHITAELEFMGLLATKEAYARVYHGPQQVRMCRRAQRRFWREHLGSWLGPFSVLLARRASGGLYAELAACLGVFAESEGRNLGSAVAATEVAADEPSFTDIDCSVDPDACPLAAAGAGR
jgi:DMSO reductase family type II enzyme chaperone